MAKKKKKSEELVYRDGKFFEVEEDENPWFDANPKRNIEQEDDEFIRSMTQPKKKKPKKVR